MIKNAYTYIIVFTIITLSSCIEQKATAPHEDVHTEGQLPVQIIKSAGALWDDTDAFLTMPFNLGRSGANDIILIGRSLAPSSTVNAIPLGAIRAVENDSLRTYCLAIPTDSAMRTISPQNFDEFSTIHSSAKWIIEQYMVNRQGPNSCRLQSWEDDKFAINYLLR